MRTLFLCLPVLAMLCVNVYAKDREFTRLEGEIKNVSQNQITVESVDDRYDVNFNEDTIFILNERIINQDRLEEGLEVIVLFEANQDNSRNNLREVTALAILLQGHSHNNIYIGRFNTENNGLVSSNNGLRVPFSTSYTIYNNQGENENLTLQNLDGAMLAVVYGGATFSNPTIPINPVIFLLSITNENVQTERPQVSPPLIEVEISETTDDGKINLLDFLPFWAGGRIGAGQYSPEYLENNENNGNESRNNTASNSISDNRIYGTNNNDQVDEFEDIIDENFFIGIEILVDGEQIVIKESDNQE